jgi:hypothetical protein
MNEVSTTSVSSQSVDQSRIEALAEYLCCQSGLCSASEDHFLPDEHFCSDCLTLAAEAWAFTCPPHQAGK